MSEKTQTTTKRQFDNKKARAMSGAAALWEMIQTIGKEDSGDHDIAEILVGYELDLRALLEVFQENLS